MKRTQLILLALATQTVLYAQSGPSPTDGQKLDEVLKAAASTHIFNGVALIARHDSILLFKAYGWRDYENKIPHDTNSIFQIGSLTKPFTATLILWLQEQGRLRLSDKLSQYFPAYQYGDRITIQNLLTHTSGIYNFTDQNYMLNEADRHFSQQDFWGVIGDKALDFDPGTEFAYSNSNYMILGYLVEKITGNSYEQMVRKVIFEKAGMRHSGFDFTRLRDPNKSVGYDSLNERTHPRARISDSSATYAAGGMYTTAGDLFRWNQALNSGKIISPASLQEAYTPFKTDYGYGWYIEKAGNTRFVAHNGGIWGFQSHFKSFPEDHTCIILLRNEMLGFEDYALSLHQILFHDPNYYIPRQAVSLSPDSLKPYTGRFQLDGKPEFKADITIEDDHLLVTWTGLAPQRVYAEGRGQFFFKAYNAQLIYKREVNGKIIGFDAHVGGNIFAYSRIAL